MLSELQERTNKCMAVWGYDKPTAGALIYAETYGIIEYHVNKNNMIFYISYPMEYETYKAVVDLDTFKETRIALKHYYIAYKSRIGGKYFANYGG